MNKHDDIQILIGSKGSRESELSTEKKTVQWRHEMS